MYEEANSWFTKRQILSVFVNDYSKAQFQLLIPGVSIWAIDEARRHAAKVGVGKPVPQMEAITRERLDPNKVDHFLDFFSRPNFVQDIAYGTNTLKLYFKKIQYFTGTYQNKIMIQNQKRSEKRKKNWCFLNCVISCRYHEDIIICIVSCFLV